MTDQGTAPTRSHVRTACLFAVLLVGLIRTFTIPSTALAAESCPAKIDASFSCLATSHGIGGVLAAVVGPGLEPGSERYYQSYYYNGGTLDIVAVDPDTGGHQVFVSPLPGEMGAWALARGPDQNLYIGTFPHAHILRLNPRTGAFIDLGRPSDSEEYIWSLTLGTDGRFYGGTYPSAKLIRFDPATGRGEDLGRMDPREQYANQVAASNDGFVYVAVGYGQAHLVVYEIATGQHRDILPEPYRTVGRVFVSRRSDGQVYASLADTVFRLRRWDATVVDASSVPDGLPANRLNDGRLVIQAADGVLRVEDPVTKAVAEHPFQYAGKELNIFRLGLGPDGLLYTSSAMPAHVARIDPSTGRIETLGVWGRGEWYSFLRRNGALLGAAYVGVAPLLIFDPGKPITPGKDVSSNPRFIEYQSQSIDWRPKAMIEGPDHNVYLGAEPGYGQLGGPLVVWDTSTDRIESYPHLVADESVVALASLGDLVVGGTTIYGGGGSHVTQRRAALFLWDPRAKRRIFELFVEAETITDLLPSPDGLVYGFADARLFVFDPRLRRFRTTAVSVPGLIYNSASWGEEGWIWGLCTQGIFVIDPQAGHGLVIIEAPEPISAGFASDGPRLYYASGPRVYRYTRPLAAINP